MILVCILSYLNGSSGSKTKLLLKKLFTINSYYPFVTDSSVTRDYNVPICQRNIIIQYFFAIENSSLPAKPLSNIVPNLRN